MHEGCRDDRFFSLRFASAWMPVDVCRVGSHIGVGGPPVATFALAV
jgi:hypothetical protein